MPSLWVKQTSGTRKRKKPESKFKKERATILSCAHLLLPMYPLMIQLQLTRVFMEMVRIYFLTQI